MTVAKLIAILATMPQDAICNVEVGIEVQPLVSAVGFDQYVLLTGMEQ